MRIVRSQYEGTDEKLFVMPFGCWHIGHRNSDIKLVKEWVDKLDHNHRGILMGDLAETATKTSIGKGLLETNMTPKEQREYIIELLRPKAQFIDGGVVGNHEERIANDTSIDIMEDVCNTLKINYLHYQGFIKYAWNGVAYTFNVWHGAGNGATAQTAIKTAEDMANRAFADVYCVGHFHKLLKSDRIYFMPDTRNMNIIKQMQHFVVTGSALEYDEGYADMKGLQARQLGYPIIELTGVKQNKKVKITI